MSFDGGIWSYMASTGAVGTTHVIQKGQKLLSLRAFAKTADGKIQITRGTDTTSGSSTADFIAVRTGTGFDWTPAGKISPCVILATSQCDVFIERSS